VQREPIGGARFLCIYHLLKFSARLWSTPEQEKGLGANREMIWKSRWTGIQHTLAIYDRIFDIPGHEALRDAIVDNCPFRSWFIFCLTLTVTLPKPAIIMPFWDIVIDKFAAH
jgi:hypothetical protein